MAEVAQFLLSPAEVAKVLMKEQGLHEGLWQVIANFGFAVANAQNTDGKAYPAAMVTLQGVGLQKVTAPSPLAFDAAELNPAK